MSVTSDKYEYDSIAMNKVALQLFIDLYHNKYENETIKFLIEQFELVFEFDSDNSNSEVLIRFYLFC